MPMQLLTAEEKIQELQEIMDAKNQELSEIKNQGPKPENKLQS
jgi:uncharacterized membrane protein (DUF106 family)